MKKIQEKTQTEFGKLLEKHEMSVPQIGDIITGTVVSASKSEVKLDLNGIMAGVVRGRELYFEADEYANLKPGDKIEATVMEDENENGELELSFRQAGQEKTWQTLIDAYANKTNIKVKVNEANRGGLLINYMQVPAFLPVSQLSPEHYPRVSGGDKTKILEKLKSLIGEELEVKIITLEQKEEKLVVSEKDAWQEKQKDVIAQYKIGSLVDGTITAITNFGLFISFSENLEGLIHISELAWQRIDDPGELYRVGDVIKAEIINIDGSKIFLSAKKLMADPWKGVEDRYKIGDKCTGTILKVNPFGLFVELDKDIHGLAHVSQLNLPSGQKIEELYKSGDKQKFTIVSVVANEHRLGLAIPSNKEKQKETKKEKAESTEEKNAKNDITEKQKEKKDTLEEENKEEENKEKN